VVLPEVSVVTPIDFDHEAFLGSGIESIAAEKAGILKAGRPAVFAEQRLRRFEFWRCGRWIWMSRCGIRRIGGSRIFVSGDSAAGSLWLRMRRFRSSVRSLAGIRSRMRGPRLLRLISSVYPLPRFGGDRASFVAGPLERVAVNPDIILDGAHNPAGARALASYIRDSSPGAGSDCLCGDADKAVEEVTNTLFPLADEVIVTRRINREPWRLSR